MPYKDNLVLRNTEQPVSRPPVYKRLWFRIMAFALAMVLIFSIWAGGAIYIRIKPENDQDAAAQYLIDNTDYIQQDEMARLEAKLRSYSRATEFADFYQLAGTQIAAGEYEAALDSIGECLERYTGTDPGLYLDLMLKRGCLLVLLGQYPEAAEALEKVTAKDPENVDAYLILAQIYSETGDIQNLTKVLSEYLILHPEDNDLRMIYVQGLFETGDYQRALEEYDLLIQDDSLEEGRPQLLFLKALTYIQLENYEEAKTILADLHQEDADIAGINYYLGLCDLSLESYETAEVYLTDAIELQEMLQLSHYSRAICRIMKTSIDLDGAIQDLEFAANYTEADSDAVIVEQAVSLLATLQAT